MIFKDWLKSAIEKAEDEETLYWLKRLLTAELARQTRETEQLPDNYEYTNIWMKFITADGVEFFNLVPYPLEARYNIPIVVQRHGNDNLFSPLPDQIPAANYRVYRLNRYEMCYREEMDRRMS